MITVTISEAKNSFMDLVRQAHLGEEVVILAEDNMTPAARLTAVRSEYASQRLGILYDPATPIPEHAWDALFESDDEDVAPPTDNRGIEVR